MSPGAAEAELIRIKKAFDLLSDRARIYKVWERLVITHKVYGKPAHDARLAAAMIVHGLTSILTFDTTGSSRYPGIEVIHPADVN